ALNSSPHQEKEDQQPKKLPIHNKKDKSQENSNHVLLEVKIRHTLATKPFQPTLKVLADLERDDPKFAFPATQLIGLYRRL
ncbi:hypothetical protein N7501_011557, partial [Penicillium viridicatum]